MLSDYQFCEPNADVIAIQNGDSFSVLVGGKIACSTTAGAHRFRTPQQAEHFGQQLTRGYTAGTFLSVDTENYVTEKR